MARLPIPGADSGTWGTVLNEFLLQAHNPDGTLKSMPSGQIPAGSVTTTELADSAVTSAKIADGTIAEADLSPAVLAKLNSTGGTTVNADWNAASGAAQILNKPVLGTAAATNASAYATAAQGAKADTAVQPGSLSTVATSGNYTDLTNRPTIPAQLNATAGTNVTITGTYPNLTFNATPGAGVTDLSTDTTATTVTIASSTGADATVPQATGAAAGVLSAADKTKLDGLSANPAVGGDLSGTVSSAQLVDNTVTEPKLAVSNTPAANQVLSWNGSALAWATPASGGGSVTYDTLPANMVVVVRKDEAAGTWPARPTSRTDLVVDWTGTDPGPVSGMLTGDRRTVTYP